MRARKRFGQHFLAPAWADKLVEAIEPRDQDRFLEIGPGPGALTLRLAPRVAHVTAVEVDRDLAAALQPRLPANVELIVADFLDADLTSLLRARSAPRGWQPALQHLDADPVPPDRDGPAVAGLVDATLMLQREVAERLEAQPGTGDYGVLSISVQLHAGVKRLLTLPPGAFRPAPKVHSAVVRLTFRPPAAAPQDERVFEAMVRSMFTQRRKTLANALAPFASSRGMDSVVVLGAAGIDPNRRPETLDLTELTRLADRFVFGLSR